MQNPSTSLLFLTFCMEIDFRPPDAIMVFFQGRKAMHPDIRCAHCGNFFEPNTRAKNQRYCSHKECQRARKRAWQKEKLRTDPDYKANQRDCQRNWHQRHPQYYRQYRNINTASAERNRLLQRVRDAKRRPLLAKMDASILKVVLIPVAWMSKTCLQKRTR
jgi:hypothetical protein